MKNISIVLLALSTLAAASPLQEKLRLVASRTSEIKEGIKSGDYVAKNKCNDQGGCKVGAVECSRGCTAD